MFRLNSVIVLYTIHGNPKFSLVGDFRPMEQKGFKFLKKPYCCILAEGQCKNLVRKDFIRVKLSV